MDCYFDFFDKITHVSCCGKQGIFQDDIEESSKMSIVWFLSSCEQFHIEIAKKIARRERSRPIRFMSGDFTTDDIGRGYDLILISQILHAYSVKDNVLLLKKCRNSLSHGGRVVVLEFPLSNDKIYPVQSALFSVNMLVNTAGGRCYSSEEIRGWLQKVGLKDIDEHKSDDTVIISGSYSR